MQTEIYQHYRKDEKQFVDTVFSWQLQVEHTYTPYCSDFLTPREAMIAQQILNHYDDMKLHLFGGYSGAERQLLALCPTYFDWQLSDFRLSAFNIKFPAKFAEITHGKILGTLLSTGIDRSRIGDIITDGVNWHVIVETGIANFIQQQVTKIANVGVRLEAIELSDLLCPIETWQPVSVVASSLRLDTLVAKVYNFSRQRAKQSIEAGMVKLNFMVMERPDFEVGVQDIVSVRKFGRFWIEAIEGTTKKDNYRLTVQVLDK